MEIINPFQIYSWKNGPFIKFISVIQFLLLASICLDLVGLHIPLVRQFIGFVYLLFVPGIVIIRILKLGKLDNIESLLYTIGLSISFLMFLGFFINEIYLLIGIKKPISIIPLITTIYLIISTLSVLSYYEKEHLFNCCYVSNYRFIFTRELLSLKPLLLFFIPFLAVYGTYNVNVYHRNNLIVAFIIVISVLIFSYGFLNIIPKRYYSLTVFLISISLLFHNSLISKYVWGCDIQYEYYASHLVLSDSYWNSSFRHNINSMLSIVMFAPISSLICSVDLMWILKILYPFLFSLVPLGIYKISEKQTTEEIAFLSCIYFISGFMFYTEMLALARQQISELFFILIILVMLNSSMENSKKAVLSIVFLFSIVVSHYGFSYLFMIALLLSLTISKFIILTDRKRFNSNPNEVLNPKQMSFEKIIGVNFIFLTFIFILSWYIYTSSGVAFSTVIQIGKTILDNVLTDFGKTQGATIAATSAASSMRNITKYLHLISICLITIGILKLLVKRKIMRFNNTYIVLSFAYFVICIFGLVVPSFASQLNTSRVYQISLLVLAPFFSIGGASFFNAVTHIKLNDFWIDIPSSQSLLMLSTFLSVFFLFNSGLIYEIKGEEPSSVSLNSTHYPFIYNDEDVFAANWINSNKNLSSLIYADVGGTYLLGSINPDQSIPFVKESVSLPKNGFIFTTTLNNGFHQIYVYNGVQLENMDIKYLTEGNKISSVYNNGYGKIGFYNTEFQSTKGLQYSNISEQVRCMW